MMDFPQYIPDVEAQSIESGTGVERDSLLGNRVTGVTQNKKRESALGCTVVPKTGHFSGSVELNKTQQDPKLLLDDLPVEILAKIFKYVSSDSRAFLCLM